MERQIREHEGIGAAVAALHQEVAVFGPGDPRELQRQLQARAEAERDGAAAAADRAEAARLVVSAKVTSALVDAGVTDKKVRGEAAVLVMAKLDLGEEVLLGDRPS